jgi:CheY-like chemotaxis protein
VWDTGRGIPPDEHERIFQEYTQLDNPERDRVKGLGLGLAIVRRLSRLLACPVDLRSTPGRGSCFGVSLPVAAGQPMAGTSPDLIGNPAAERGLILVVDDEQSIQEGMSRLLAGWGYGVIVAGSGQEMLEQLADCPDIPVLIICDYRLRGEETGAAVIERLQSEYNETIPAVLITGDTGPDRLVEAQASGFLLLHKPVPNGKLRAAIGHLIAAARAQADDAAA